jgi:hypothetical protein
MKKPWIMILVILIFLSSFSFAQEINSNSDSLKNVALDEALKCIKLKKEDLTFRNDYLEIDAFRLEKIDQLMKNPLEISSFSEKLGLSLEKGKDSPTALLKNGFKSIISKSKKENNFEINELQTEFKITPEDELFLNKNLKKIGKLPEELKKAIGYLFLGLSRADKGWEDALAELSSEEIDSLKNHFPILILEDVMDEFKSVDEMDKEQKYEEKLAKDLIPLAEKFKLEKAYSQNIELCKMVEKAISILNEYLSTSPKIKSNENDRIITTKTEYGEIVVGGFGSSVYKGNPRIIIDLGGDDQYNLTSSEGSSVVLDLGGNDTYIALGDYNIGSGFFGTGILVDKSGDDNYMGRNFSLGAGLFGVGILIDEEGNDKYFGDIFTQGAGGFGVGILSDLQGADQYNGALYAQGFGFVSGFGALIDSSGNDSYFAGGKYKDILRYKDHYLSLSQGFAYGLRPIMSGGFGFLCDFSGNDIYISDIFGQGASYWWGLGSLIDFSGNDKYISYQYAQGAATHMTLGLLLDKSGDDDYISHGVSQGCGHDLACGILEDRSGNDNYLSFDLSQGAGSANGLGIQMDYQGDDSYLVTLKSNTQGYGNPRREYGSIGIFLDLSGKDKYSGNGEDNTWWTTPSMWGVGVDGEFLKAASK